MTGAFDHTFQAPIPGMSLCHKRGDLPHEHPPKYTDPHEACEFFFKQLTTPQAQHQIWETMEMPGATAWHIARALLFKAALQGIIQLNLAIVIYPIVISMVVAVAKAGNVSNLKDKVTPKFKSKYKDKYIKDELHKIMRQYDKYGWLGDPQHPSLSADGTDTSDQSNTPQQQPDNTQAQPPQQQGEQPQQGLLNLNNGAQ